MIDGYTFTDFFVVNLVIYLQSLVNQAVNLLEESGLKENQKMKRLVIAAIRTGNTRLLENINKRLIARTLKNRLEEGLFGKSPEPEDLQGEIFIGEIDE